MGQEFYFTNGPTTENWNKPNDNYHFFENEWYFHLNIAYSDFLSDIHSTLTKKFLRKWKRGKHSFIDSEDEEYWYTSPQQINTFIPIFKKGLVLKKYHQFWSDKWVRFTMEDQLYLKYWIDFLTICLQYNGFKIKK